MSSVSLSERPSKSYRPREALILIQSGSQTIELPRVNKVLSYLAFEKLFCNRSPLENDFYCRFISFRLALRRTKFKYFNLFFLEIMKCSKYIVIYSHST